MPMVYKIIYISGKMSMATGPLELSFVVVIFVLLCFVSCSLSALQSWTGHRRSRFCCCCCWPTSDWTALLAIPQKYIQVSFSVKTWCRTVVCFHQAKTLRAMCWKYDSVPQIFAHGGGGVQPKHKNFTKHSCFVFVRALHATKTRLQERCHIHSIHSNFTRGKPLGQAIFLRSFVPPQRSLDTWPPI